MNTNNELLIHIYETSDMGVKSTKKLLKILKDKDNKIKGEIERELKEYENIYKKARKILKKQSIKPTTNIVANISANAAMKMEIDKDNSDSKIADILMRGFVMGVAKIEKKIKDYKKEVDHSTLKLAKDLLKFQEESMKKVQKYL
jgi:ABC-type nitrate/sulfonate/bicarbonate transport system ATPase subunit